jgi:hypothetical protein
MQTYLRIKTPESLPKLHSQSIQNVITYLSYRGNEWRGDGINLMKKVLSKADVDSQYLSELKECVEDYSTTRLVALCSPLGDYQELPHRNAVNALDTAFGNDPASIECPVVMLNVEEAAQCASHIDFEGIEYRINHYSYNDKTLYVEDMSDNGLRLFELADLKLNVEKVKFSGHKPIIFSTLKHDEFNA